MSKRKADDILLRHQMENQPEVWMNEQTSLREVAGLWNLWEDRPKPDYHVGAFGDRAYHQSTLVEMTFLAFEARCLHIAKTRWAGTELWAQVSAATWGGKPTLSFSVGVVGAHGGAAGRGVENAYGVGGTRRGVSMAECASSTDRGDELVVRQSPSAGCTPDGRPTVSARECSNADQNRHYALTRIFYRPVSSPRHVS